MMQNSLKFPFGAGTVHVSAFMKPNVIIEHDPMVQLVVDFLDWKADEFAVEIELQFSGGMSEGKERVDALRHLYISQSTTARNCVLSCFPVFYSLLDYSFANFDFWGQYFDIIYPGDADMWYKWSLRGRSRFAGWDGKTSANIAGLLMEMRQAGFVYSAAAPLKPWVDFLRGHGIIHGCKFI